MRYFRYLFLIVLLVLCLNCKNTGNEVIFDSQFENEKWNELVEMRKGLRTINEKINWCDKVVNLFIEGRRQDRLFILLGELSISVDNDRFASYINFVLSDLYWDLGKMDVSTFYMEKVLPVIYEFDYKHRKIGQTIALRAIQQFDYPDKESKYKLLLNNYKDYINEGKILYELSELYKRDYRIDKAMEIVERIINLHKSGELDTDSVDIDRVMYDYNFYKSDKHWVYHDLHELIDRIKYAIRVKNIQLLYKYTSKIDFKVLHMQNKTKIRSFRQLAIHCKWSNNIVFARELEPSSNENDAYLKTMNWNFPQLRTWYFYFKKVDYPFDENIDGGWEWRGIYFGNWF